VRRGRFPDDEHSFSDSASAHAAVAGETSPQRALAAGDIDDEAVGAACIPLPVRRLE
jgi:hypothetical protein